MNKLTSISSLLFVFLLLVQGCIPVEPSKGENYLTEGTDNTSISSANNENMDEIKQQYLSQQEQDRREDKLLEAESNYNANPDSLPYIIWYGRRLAYLGRYQEAINVYSEGLRKFPRSYKLFRHRGHRYINVRQFDNAISDLQNAVFYATGAPHEVEQDGIPNALNKSLTNVHWNIWYHLALAYYMKGNYDKTISSLKQCIEYNKNADLEVKTTNWLYVTYRKIGNTDAADALISVIPSRMNLIGSDSRLYHDLIMLYRGFLSPDRIIRSHTVNGEIEANVGYGVGNWYLMEGQRESAINIFNRVMSASQKDSFGYIATQVELASLATL